MRQIVPTMIVWASVASAASAQCGQFFRQRVVVQHHAAAVVAVPQVSYFVGAPVRLEALVQQALRADPQYEEFRRWKLQGPQAQREPHPAREAIKVEPTYPQLQAKCARCHSGDQPKGGVTLDGTRPVPAEVALTSLRMLRDRKGPEEMASVLAGLKDADLPALMQELLEVSK